MATNLDQFAGRVMTKKEFSEAHNVDYSTASGTIAFLLSKGLVVKMGQRPAAGGKGKPNDLFLIPPSVSIILTEEKVAA